MSKPSSLNVLLLSAVLAAYPLVVNAQSDNSSDSASSAGQDTTGGGGPTTGGGGRGHRTGKMGGGHMRMPTREQVLGLPSLSDQQKQGIEAIYRQGHENMRPLIVQLRQMRSDSNGASSGGGNAGNVGSSSGADSGSSTPNPQEADLKRQIRQQRRSTWQQVKAKLTPDQIIQLQQQSAGGQQSAPQAGGGSE